MESVKEAIGRAQRAGLTLQEEDGQLIIRGPRRAEPLARRLLERKPEVLEALRGAEAGPGPEIEVQKAHRLIGRLGWCALQSGALDGEIIVLARDKSVVIPTPWTAYPVYTLAEIDGLVGISREHLRRVHAAKQTFNGTVTE